MLMCLCLVFAAGSAHALSNSPFPTPGEYRTDIESITRSTAATVTTERRHAVDGATGIETIETRSSLDDKPVRTVTAPTRPRRHCVQAGMVGPAVLLGLPGSGVCRTGPTVTSGDLIRYTNYCSEGRYEVEVQRLDDRIWEVRSIKESTPAPMTASPATAQEAMAPVIAALEKQARSGSPEEAAIARQQLELLSGNGTGRAAVAGTSTVVVQRLTRIGEHCNAR